AGMFACLRGDMPAGLTRLTEAAELGAEIGERAIQGWALWFKGLQTMFSGAPIEGRGDLTTARDILREVGDELGQVRATNGIGLSYMMDHDLARAREIVKEGLASAIAANDRWSQGQSNLYLGILTESSTDANAATSYFREAVSCMRPYRDTTLLPVALVGQASVVAARDPETALRLLAAAAAARARNGGEFAPFFGAIASRARAAASKGVGTDAERIWKEGSRLTVDDAITLAFGTPRASAARPSTSLGVSARELEVALLVAEGLQNKEIATRLHLSVRTVESHVRHLLTKTGLVNRTQLASWAHEHGQ
ncbi:MAG: hypothetical protein QOF21_1603, partial [Actinomycetota bacterium]